MKLLSMVSILLVLPSCATPEIGWKTVNAGFRITIPRDWKKQNGRPIDSNCGGYEGTSAELEYDQVFGLGYTRERSQAAADDLRKKEANPTLLPPGEEVWHVNGRIASFTNGKVDPEIYGSRRYPNVAKLYVPYEGEPAYLEIFVNYRDQADLPTALRVLKSVEWKIEQKSDPLLKELSALAPAFATPRPNEVVVVTAVHGKVQWSETGATWSKLKRGQRLATNSIVKCQADGLAGVVTGDNSLRLIILDGSTLALTCSKTGRLGDDDGMDIKIKLTAGTVAGEGDCISSNLTRLVATPNSVFVIPAARTFHLRGL